jgi:hypothetical protein
MKYLKKATYLTAGVGLAMSLRASNCFATALDIVRPIENKATELNAVVVWGFWILVGVVLGYRILMISVGDENNRMKHMKAIGWLSGGAIAIASIAKIIVWFKAV